MAEIQFDILKEIGLTKTEIDLYITLLKIGPNLASTLSKKAKVDRAVTYHALENLIRKGVVSYVIKENRKYFSASEPDKLKDLLREKEDILNQLIPVLKTLKKTEDQPLSVEVFRGKEGFKTAMEDMIRDKRPYYIIGYTGTGQKVAEFWYIHWSKRRIKRKIQRSLLVHKGNEKMDILNQQLTRVKILPDKAIHQPQTSTIIYGKDKILLYLPLEEFAGIRIRNKEIYESYKKYFDILWRQSKSKK